MGVPARGTGEEVSDFRIRDTEAEMRSVLLWLVGVPIPIILLLALCTHHL
jgi:hypothetical protein